MEYHNIGMIGRAEAWNKYSMCERVDQADTGSNIGIPE
jgi:hypothetical protein